MPLPLNLHIDASSSRIADASSSCVPAVEPTSPLLQLPPDVFAQRVLSRCRRQDRAAFRGCSRACRLLANAGVAVVQVPRRDLPRLCALQLPARFPSLVELRLAPEPPQGGDIATRFSSSSSQATSRAADTQGAPSSSTAATTITTTTSSSQAAPRLRSLSSRFPETVLPAGGGREVDRLGAELAAFITGCGPQLPSWHALSLGCCQEVAPLGLDPTPGLVAAAAGRSGGGGGGDSPGCHPPARLTRLVLRGTQLGEDTLDALGALTGLQELELGSTRATTTSPLSALTALTALTTTITPPLAPALAPLAALPHLVALSLRSISPARGWGAALAALVPTTCGGSSSTAGSGLTGLTRLQLLFASVADKELMVLSRLGQLRQLDLTCSRPLTRAVVPALASLPALTSCSLTHTGLVLDWDSWLALGTGCRHLTHLAVDGISLRGGGGSASSQPGPSLYVTQGADSWQQGREGQATSTHPAAGRHDTTSAPRPPPPGTSPTSPTASHAAAAAVNQQPSRHPPGPGPPAGPSRSPPLAHLELMTCCRAADWDLLLGELPGLQHLAVSHVGPVAGLAACLARAAPALTQLTLLGCSRFPDQGYQTLGALTRLGALHLDMAAAGDVQLALVVNGLTGLTHLTVERLSSSCSPQPPPWVPCLRSCQQLGLVGCVGVVQQLVAELLGGCPALQQLQLSGSSTSQLSRQETQLLAAAADAAGVVLAMS